MANEYKLSYTAQEINNKLGEVDRLSEEIVDQNILNPDSFDGTDSEKLQACFDALAETGGTISINRTYTLTSNIAIKHSSGASHQIVVVGTGKVAGIEFGGYSFVGYDPTSKETGGLVFEHLRLNGTGIGFDGNTLIRLFFNSCVIRQFTNLVYADDYIQTVYLNDCAIRYSGGATIKTASNANAKCYDVRICGCLVEWGAELFHVYSTYGCSIVQNCIEGFTGTPITVENYMYMLDISSNYFELNGNGVSIDFSGISPVVTANVSNNMFMENTTRTKGSILLPKQLSKGLIISGNAGTTIAEVQSGTTGLGGVYYFANNGGVIDENGALKSIETYDIASVLSERVTYVNGKTGSVTLNASDVGAVTEGWVQNKINDINAQGIQQTPLFANSIEECKDKTKVYVLPDGYLYANVQSTITVEPENEIPKSTDTDRKTIYNGTGFRTGYRINSSGEAVQYTGANADKMATTGFIPAKVGDTIKCTNYKGHTDYTSYVAAYNASNVCTGKLALDSTATLSALTLDAATFGSDFNAIRVSGIITSATSIINTSTGGTQYIEEWKNTGHAFVPADYESRILALEAKVAELMA